MRIRITGPILVILIVAVGAYIAVDGSSRTSDSESTKVETMIVNQEVSEYRLPTESELVVLDDEAVIEIAPGLEIDLAVQLPSFAPDGLKLRLQELSDAEKSIDSECGVKYSFTHIGRKMAIGSTVGLDLDAGTSCVAGNLELWYEDSVTGLWDSIGAQTHLDCADYESRPNIRPYEEDGFSNICLDVNSELSLNSNEPIVTIKQQELRT